jgi:hypothetical protein
MGGLTMHPSLSAALASLDDYIVYLTEIRSQLAQGGLANGFMPPTSKTAKRAAKRVTKRTTTNGKGRKDEVAKFIKAHGPSKRKEILKGTSVPAGTIAYALNDKTMFKRLPDGKWDIAA